MQKRILSRVAGIVFSLALASSAYAVSGCTNAWLNGSYGMQLSGISDLSVAKSVAGVAVPAGGSTGAVGPVIAATSDNVAGIAWLSMDGGGSLFGYAAANVAGNWIQGNFTGTYTVNVDCSVSFTLADSSGAVENFSGVVVNRGDSTLVAQTDAGAGVAGSIRPMRGSCQTSDLAGDFGIQYSGLAASVPFKSTGVVTMDGSGNVIATEYRLTNGSYSQVASNGAITVNPDCSANLTLTSSVDGSTVTLTGMLNSDEKQLSFVRSDAGTAVFGVLVAQ